MEAKGPELCYCGYPVDDKCCPHPHSRMEDSSGGRIMPSPGQCDHGCHEKVHKPTHPEEEIFEWGGVQYRGAWPTIVKRVGDGQPWCAVYEFPPTPIEVLNHFTAIFSRMGRLITRNETLLWTKDETGRQESARDILMPVNELVDKLKASGYEVSHMGPEDDTYHWMNLYLVDRIHGEAIILRISEVIKNVDQGKQQLRWHR